MFKIKSKGLLKKLFIYQIFLFVIITISLIFALSFFEKKFWKDYVLKESGNKLKLLNPVIFRELSKGIGRGSVEESISLIEGVIKDKEDIKGFAILDKDGKIIIKSGLIGEETFNIKEYKTYRELYYKELKIDKKIYLDITIPFETLGKTRFYVKYVLFSKDVEYQIRNLNILIFIIGCFYLIFALSLSYFYVRKIIVPLKILTSKASLIKEGDLNQRLPEFEDEIGELSSALTTMIEELKKNQQELVLKNERLNKAVEEALYLQKQIINYEKFAALGKISAGMSHEIDNPLGIIIGHCEYLMADMKEDNPHKEDIETILRESKRIKNILRSMLDFSKPKESKIKDIEIKNFIEGIIKDFSFQKIFKKIEAKLDIEDLIVRADEEKLHQSFVNIILNAIQAMPQGGSIYIDARKRGNKAIISVKDEGCGIPEELLDKVFDIFFSTKKDGTGIGLAITKKFIEDMEGTITIRSKVNEGTEVTITLPLVIV
ncbi:MAG: HAMP domain-containing histidine kinase [Proteobacteria bacterium]|nr:HAMP domain-containing histidine kinase [Pseudomonadota bacterium]